MLWGVTWKLSWCLETWQAAKARIPQLSRQCWWLTAQSCVALKKLLSTVGNCLAKGYEPLRGVACFQILVVGSETGQRHSPLALIWDCSEGIASMGRAEDLVVPAPQVNLLCLFCSSHSLTVLFLRALPSAPSVHNYLPQSLFWGRRQQTWSRHYAVALLLLLLLFSSFQRDGVTCSSSHSW